MTQYSEINVNASAILQSAKNGIIGLKMFDALNDKGKRTGLQVVTSEDNDVKHLSVYHEERSPSYREVYAAKNHFFPGIEMAQYYPEGENVLSNVQHLWEVKKA